jgi:hypothetical protein
MAQVGDIAMGYNVGLKDGHSHMLCACLDCGKERWVRLKGGKADYLRCKRCARVGERSNFWKGGIADGGYKLVNLSKNDFFHPMQPKGSRVLEHRLVMAKHLGRNLHTWELVHHKNHIRADNRIENLQLVSSEKHWQITLLENKINKLLNGQEELKREIRLLRLENKQLKEVTI